MKTLTLTAIVALLLAFCAPTSALAQAAKKKELQQRFQERYPQIRQLKSQGVIGETSEGYLDFVAKRDPKAAELVDEENKDRKELYAIIAKEEGITVTVVAERAAKRNFEKARPGEYLKEDGKWRKKT